MNIIGVYTESVLYNLIFTHICPQFGRPQDCIVQNHWISLFIGDRINVDKPILAVYRLTELQQNLQIIGSDIQNFSDYQYRCVFLLQLLIK